MQRRRAVVKAKQTLQKEPKKGHFTVEAVLDDKIDENGVKRFLVKWKGYSTEENTWEREANLKNNEALITYLKGKNVKRQVTLPAPKRKQESKSVHVEYSPDQLPKPADIPEPPSNVHEKKSTCTATTHRENALGYCRPRKYHIYKVGVDTGWRTKTGQEIYKTVHGGRVIYYVNTKKDTKRYISAYNHHYLRKAQRDQISAIQKLQAKSNS
jgi:hypothetical protein